MSSEYSVSQVVRHAVSPGSVLEAKVKLDSLPPSCRLDTELHSSTTMSDFRYPLLTDIGSDSDLLQEELYVNGKQYSKLEPPGVLNYT